MYVYFNFINSVYLVYPMNIVPCHYSKLITHKSVVVKIVILPSVCGNTQGKLIFRKYNKNYNEKT